MSKKEKRVSALLGLILSERSKEVVGTGNRSLILLVIACVLVPFVAVVPLARTALFTYWPGAARDQKYVDGLPRTAQM